MKREIKFRVWDTMAHKMEPVGEITFDTGLEVAIGNYNGNTRSVNVQYQPHIILMQYTGLHDKNGREIYESDILKVTGEDGESYAATVKWFGDEGYPAFDLEGIPAEWNYDANALATILNSGVETCEVIGNVHDSHELSDGE